MWKQSCGTQMQGKADPQAGAGRRWELAAYLVRERKLGLAMTGGGLLYFALCGIGLDVLPCPLLRTTGLPCPGCGMTRSCLALLHGEWRASWDFNPFGPVFALFWAVVAAGLVLPKPWRERFADRLGQFEQRSRWAGWVACGLAIYALTRWL